MQRLKTAQARSAHPAFDLSIRDEAGVGEEISFTIYHLANDLRHDSASGPGLTKMKTVLRGFLAASMRRPSCRSGSGVYGEFISSNQSLEPTPTWPGAAYGEMRLRP